MKNINDHLNELTGISVQKIQDLIHHSQHNLTAISAGPDFHTFLQTLQIGVNTTQLEDVLQRLGTTFLQYQQIDTGVQAIRFIDTKGFVLVKVREGKIINREGPMVPSIGIRSVSNKASRDFFRNTMQLGRGEVWISNLERGWMEGEEHWCQAMVRFATPIFFPDGTRAGVLIMNVWGKALGTMINRLVTPELGTAFIVERNLSESSRHGIYLFHKNQTCEFGNQTGSRIRVFQDFPESITAKWISDDKGISYAPVNHDILVHQYYSPYSDPARGWVIVIRVKKDVIMAPLAAIKTKVWFSALGTFALMIAAVLFFARSLTLPIRSVIDGTLAISRDLSSRITISGKDEIGQLADNINQMAATLENNLLEKKQIERQIAQSEKLASIGEMAAGLAHELNTPLGNIKALAVLTRKDLMDGKTDTAILQEDMDDIIEQIEKCSHIISCLLDFARKRKAQFILSNINDCIAESISLVRLRSEEKGVNITFTAGNRLPHLKIDVHLLEQVFVNILLNGIDAVSENDTISVVSEFSGSQVAIRFIDTGSGIPDEVLPRIFDPFFTTKEIGQCC